MSLDQEIGWLARGNRRDLRGFRSGMLTAIEPAGFAKDGHVIWRCRCDCGAEAYRPSNTLARPKAAPSCGCMRKVAAKKRLLAKGPWNEGKSYAISGGAHCYKTRHAWAKAVIRHYGNQCERCGWNEARCDAHHRQLKSKGGSHTVENGIVLCPNCHRVEHERASHARRDRL